MVDSLKSGDEVIMVNCYEAGLEKYKGKVFTVRSKPWMLCGSEVVKLKGIAGGFATEFLRKVDTTDESCFYRPDKLCLGREDKCPSDCKYIA